MDSDATISNTAVSRENPLGSLANVIGSMTGSIPAQVVRALQQVLEARTEKSRNARLRLIRHLVDIESQATGIEVQPTLSTADELISTAQAAAILGYSRPYVAMLIDQKKLKGATISAGGHRRVSRAAVQEWKDRHQVIGTTGELRAEGKKAGAYLSTEAAVVRRIKALAKKR